MSVGGLTCTRENNEMFCFLYPIRHLRSLQNDKHTLTDTRHYFSPLQGATHAHTHCTTLRYLLLYELQIFEVLLHIVPFTCCACHVSCYCVRVLKCVRAQLCSRVRLREGPKMKRVEVKMEEKTQKGNFCTKFLF